MTEGFFFLIIFLQPILVNSCYTVENLEVIASLMEPLNIKSCILVGSWCNYIPEGIKFLSERNIHAVHFNLNKLVAYFKIMNDLQKNRKVSIVLKIDEEKDVEHVLKHLKIEVSYLEPFLGFNWIILTPEMTKKLEPSEFHIPFDCQVFLLEKSNTAYKISEIYQIRNEAEIIYTNLGYWGEKKISDLFSGDFYRRRNNFKKENLVMIVKNKMISLLYPEQVHYEFWLDLEKIFNFSTILIEEKDYNPRIIKEDAKIDLAVMHFLYNNTQNLIAPITLAKWHMYIKSNEDVIGNWMAYLKPFETKLWYGVYACFVISSTVTTTIGWLGMKILKLRKYTLYEQALVPLSAFCNQSSTQEPAIASARIARIFAYITACVIVPAYSGAIISFLMVYTPKVPFTDLETFVQDGTYKLASFKIRFANDYFQSTTRSAERIIRDRYLLAFDDFPATHEGAIEMVCSEEKISVMHFNYRMYDFPWPCRIIRVSKSIYTLRTGFEMFNQGVHYVRIFRKSINTFREAGIVQRWHKYLYGDKNKDSGNELKPLEMIKIVPLLFNVFMGVAFSTILLMVEIVHDYYKYYRRSKRLFTVPKIVVPDRSPSNAFNMFVEDANYFTTRRSIVIEYL